MTELRKLDSNNMAGLNHIYDRGMRCYNKILVKEKYKKQFKAIKLIPGATQNHEITVQGPQQLVKRFLEVVDSKYAKTKTFKILVKAIKQYSREDQRKYIEYKEEQGRG